MLRQQIIVLRRDRVGRLPFSASDRLVLGWVCGLPNTRDALAIIRPETALRWHRAGLRSYWRWKSRRRPGRPALSAEIRQLIRDMSLANPLWGAPRIHGEPLKLGIDVGQTSVAKYMVRRRGPPSQGWKTFFHNHADGIAAMDLFVVPTVSFRLLYGLLIMGHSRRRILWLDVTAHPTAEWLANQLTQAFGWECTLNYLIRDRMLAMAVSSFGGPRHSRSSDISAFALAERLCGAPDRLDPPGMSRPCRCVRRAPPAACAAVIHGLLQHCSNPPIAGEGRAHPAPCARSRRHPTTARSRWTASSICPDLIYGRDRSIYDALGLEFTLLRLGLKMVEPTRLVETAAKALGVPLSICRCGNEESPAVSGRSRLDPTGPDRCLARQFATHVLRRATGHIDADIRVG